MLKMSYANCPGPPPANSLFKSLTQLEIDKKFTKNPYSFK